MWNLSLIVPVPKKCKPEWLATNGPYLHLNLVHGAPGPKTSHSTDKQPNGPPTVCIQGGQKHRGCDICPLHHLTEHLNTPGNYAGVLYIDFSSAFNTMRPSTLYQKLQVIGVDINICNWILDYLQDRKQQVRVNTTLSSTTTAQIGAPHGCVLSQVQFTIYTNSHKSTAPQVIIIIKLADDTAAAGHLSPTEMKIPTAKQYLRWSLSVMTMT